MAWLRVVVQTAGSDRSNWVRPGGGYYTAGAPTLPTIVWCRLVKQKKSDVGDNQVFINLAKIIPSPACVYEGGNNNKQKTNKPTRAKTSAQLFILENLQKKIADLNVFLPKIPRRMSTSSYHQPFFFLFEFELPKADILFDVIKDKDDDQ